MRGMALTGLAGLLVSGLLLAGFSTPDEKALQGFCGAASKPALEECAAAFNANTGVGVHLQFSGSGTMLSRLLMSGKGDLYIPGSPDYMTEAVNRGVVAEGSRHIIAYLVPAILVPEGNPKGIKSLKDLSKDGVRVGIGNPDAVCVGLYAIELLEHNELLDQVSDNIVVHAKSCSGVCSLVAMNKVDATLGWRVFGEWKPDRVDTVLLDPDQVPRLAYVPAGVSRSTQDRGRSQRFLDFLRSRQGRKIFARWGYIASESEARKFAPRAEIGGRYTLPAEYRPQKVR